MNDRDIQTSTQSPSLSSCPLSFLLSHSFLLSLSLSFCSGTLLLMCLVSFISVLGSIISIMRLQAPCSIAVSKGVLPLLSLLFTFASIIINDNSNDNNNSNYSIRYYMYTIYQEIFTSLYSHEFCSVREIKFCKYCHATPFMLPRDHLRNIFLEIIEIAIFAKI